MNREPSWLPAIEDEAAGKPVLLVEGSDDNVILSYFLEKHRPGSDQRIFIGEAGGKPEVIRGLKHRPQWIGVVDRDVWSQDDVDKVRRQTPRLFVLSRFCIESFFCVPEELWPALPPSHRGAVEDNIDRLKRPIFDVLPDWVAHSAMWRVLRIRAEGVRSRDIFPHALQKSPITDEDEIRRILETWHRYLDPERILEGYRAERQRGLALSVVEQFAGYVVGDKFFKKVIASILDELFGATDKNWLERFRDEQIQPPPDLTALFDEILDQI
jgi:hypothetical protein